MLSPLNNSLAADVTLNNTSLFFDGPSVAQGNVGTWFASGSVAVILSPAFTGEIFAKLWDGTTVMASGIYVPDVTGVGNRYQSISLSGFITAPTGNIRISVKDVQNNNSVMTGNITQQGKDSTITAIRIG
jgi:hypothetical protein